MRVLDELAEIKSVVNDYLQGMIYGKAEQLHGAMHEKCMQAGHMPFGLEFISRDEFISEILKEKPQVPGSAIPHEISLIDVTGDIAIVKVTDACFGTVWTDYLTLLKHDGRWTIIMKAFYDNARSVNGGTTPGN